MDRQTYRKTGGEKMNTPANIHLETVMSKVPDNLKTVKYGDVSVTLKIHDSRVVSVVHSVTQTIRETKEKNKMSL
jgi:hypothetical protein